MTVITAVGDGLLMTLGVLYFTRIVGLPVGRVGLGLTLAGALGVLASVPFGRLADRIGARLLMLGMLSGQTVAAIGYVFVGSFATFVLCACLVIPLQRTAKGVAATMYAELLLPDSLIVARSYLRALTNVGVGLGAALAAIALAVDTRPAYVAAILGDAASFAIAAAILLRVRSPGRRTVVATERRERARPLRDRRYLTVTALHGVLFLQYGLLDVGLPAWVVDHTSAPRATAAALLILNTVLCMTLQVRAARRIRDLDAARSAARWGGACLAAGCVLYGLAAGAGPWLATGALVAGMVLQTAAELTTSTAGWVMSYDLAGPAAPGVYQGVFNMGSSVATMLAPALLSATTLSIGLGGWLLLGGAFLVAGVAVTPASRLRPGRVPLGACPTEQGMP